MSRRRKGFPIHGWLLLDKPLGFTSTKAVSVIKRLLKPQKIGHAGTLDPLANGLLPLGLGEATKTMPYIVDASKDYEFTLCFGFETSTDDLEGEVVTDVKPMPNEQSLIDILPQFTGRIDQIPPIYSALKVDGKRAYDLARQGETPDLKSRSVSIFNLICTNYDSQKQEASFQVTCSKGTYIRALGRDIARALDSFGHISALKRTRVGPFSLKDAISLEKCLKIGDSALLEACLAPVMTALDDIPALALTAEEVQSLRHGQPISALDVANRSPLTEVRNADVSCAYLEGKPVALVRLEGGMIRSVRVLNT